METPIRTTVRSVRNRAGRETRTRILSAAQKVLAEKGLDGLTVKAVCDEAAVRAGSFYNLFKSKEQVVLTVVREAITAVDPDPGRTGSDSVAELVEAYIAFVEEQPELARIYLIIAFSGGLTDPSLGQRILRHHQERLERFRDALRRDRPDLTDEAVWERAEALVAALNGYAFHEALDPRFDFAGHARRLLQLDPAR